MATSGTAAFRLNVEDIITEAYERCGINAESRTGYQAVSARRSMNILFSEWANRGINYWTVQNNTLALVKDQTTPYTLPVGTIDLIDAVIRDSSTGSNIDTVLNRISIADFNQLPDKTSSGKPSQYMIDKQYTPNIYVWQIPDTNEDADVPYRWSDCICAGLASKLSLKFAPDRFQVLDQVYERSFEFAASTDNDGVTMRVRPTAMNLS